jgi:phytoene dehydrogenase-like protein
VADLVQEVFESEAVRGPLAARGVLGTAMGAWATGSAYVFLNESAGTDGCAAGTTVYARGGTSRLAEALASAARAVGVEIRTGTPVVAVRSKDGRVQGVTLAGGRGSAGAAMIVVRRNCFGESFSEPVLREHNGFVLGPALLKQARLDREEFR